MIYLKIEDNKGLYRVDKADESWIDLDQINKEHLLMLLKLASEDDFEMIEYNDELLQNPAHNIIYKNIYNKFTEFLSNKTRFKDSADALYKTALDKYKTKEASKHIWKGASSKEYTYYIWDLPANLRENQNGNYIFVKLNKLGKWDPIYIGQGDLKECTENNPQATCISQKGATHVHVNLNAVEADRQAEVKDIIANFINSKKPTGCNEEDGG